MSKKLIAIASAAALALAALVAVPANSAVLVVTYTTGDDVTATKYSTAKLATAGSATMDVPSNNVLEYTDTADRDSLMKVTVTTAVGDVVSASATGAKIVAEELDAAGDEQDSKAGASTFSKTATSSSVTFFVFTTSTAVASLKTTVAGNSEEIFFKANPGPEYNISVAHPTSVASGITPSADNLLVTVTDVFGNNVSGASVSASVFGGGGAVDDSSPDYSSTSKKYGAKLSATSAGAFALTVSITATDVDGLPDAVTEYFATLNSSSPDATIATLTAQVAALIADYNALAAKWNKKAKKKKNKVALK
jgi:hypothetical protein